jgi:Fe-S-cluster containining protein
MSCCHGAHIALDPYEIARLARNLHLTTTEFIARFLTEGGIVLRNREDTSCVLLGADRCTVYDDRPQVCRTYPLNRLRWIDRESFSQYLRLPTSTGIYGKDATVADFLKKNDVDDFYAAKDRYFDIALRIAAVLGEAVKRKPGRFATIRSIIEERSEFRGPPSEIPSLIDVDRVVSDHCRERKLELPATIPAKIAIHMRVIEEKIAAISARQKHEQAHAAEEESDLLEMAALAGALGAATDARVVLAFVNGVFGWRDSKTT